MMPRRAFTMIELMVTLVLTAAVTAAVVGLFGFASVRLADASVDSTLQDQVNAVADRIEATIRNADSCFTRDSGATLVCLMPQNGMDTDGDGHDDAYYPDGIDSNGDATYTTLKRVWFYSAGTGGTYGAGSGYVWRAEKSSSGGIGAANVDTSFAYYYGGGMRFPLVNSLSFAVSSGSKLVTFTVSGSSRIGQETSTGATDSASSRTVAVTRQVVWRN